MAMPSYKPTIAISAKDYPDLPDLKLDDTGEIVLTFEVVGVNKYDDETLEGETRSCTLEYQIKSMSVKKITLEEAGERAKEHYMKTQVTPAP